MITILFINLLLVMFAALSSFLPVVTELPFGIDEVMVQASGYAHFLFTVIPPLGIMFTGFIAILAFKMTLMIIRAIPIIGRMIASHRSGFN